MEVDEKAIKPEKPPEDHARIETNDLNQSNAEMNIVELHNIDIQNLMKRYMLLNIPETCQQKDRMEARLHENPLIRENVSKQSNNEVGSSEDSEDISSDDSSSDGSEYSVRKLFISI